MTAEAQISPSYRRARGQLRVYLGAAPGVGKTFTMLEEAHRRLRRGTDIVVGVVETHNRQATAALLEGLEVVPRASITYKGAAFTEMDTDAIVARRPEVVLVDELAHTNVPGSRHTKRWQDVEELLAAGIDVLSTVNVQHLESVNDAVHQITEVVQRETIPDEVVRAADQIELVDMTPEALRRRMAHGNVYASDKVDAALRNYFRLGNLTALREIALLWLANRVDEALRKYRQDNDITATWDVRERVLVAVTGGPESEALIRRAARIAERAAEADLVVVHIVAEDGLRQVGTERIDELRRLADAVGGSFDQVTADDIPTALLDVARNANATQLVLGTSRRSRFARFLRRGVAAQVIADSGSIDVHLVTHDQSSNRPTLPTQLHGLDWRRRLSGILLAGVGLPLLTVVLHAAAGALALSSVLLLYLGFVVAVALVGGGYPAVLAAAGASALANFYFTPPTGRFTIAERNNVIALGVFLVLAVSVATVVEISARRLRQIARARAEAELLAGLSRLIAQGQRDPGALLEQVRTTFEQQSVTLLQRTEGEWNAVNTVGYPPSGDPSDADTDISVNDQFHLALRGRALSVADVRVLRSFATQVVATLEQEELRAQAAKSQQLSAANDMRAALLAAVSHDLRTPLATVRASVDTLLAPQLHLEEADRLELLESISGGSEQLRILIENLLDASRLASGPVRPVIRPTGVDEVIARALLTVQGSVDVQVPDDLPPILVDPGLAERAVANIIDNAQRYGGGAAVTAREVDAGVAISVIDQGPGVPAEQLATMFAPFQRLGDQESTGIGLGLAVAQGFITAMDGSIEPRPTPHGGLTMVVTFPIVKE